MSVVVFQETKFVDPEMQSSHDVHLSQNKIPPPPKLYLRRNHSKKKCKHLPTSLEQAADIFPVNWAAWCRHLAASSCVCLERSFFGICLVFSEMRTWEGCLARLAGLLVRERTLVWLT